MNESEAEAGRERQQGLGRSIPPTESPETNPAQRRHDVLQAALCALIALGGLAGSRLPYALTVVGFLGAVAAILALAKWYEGGRTNRQRGARAIRWGGMVVSFVLAAWVLIGDYQRARLDSNLLYPANEPTPPFRSGAAFEPDWDSQGIPPPSPPSNPSDRAKWAESMRSKYPGLPWTNIPPGSAALFIGGSVITTGSKTEELPVIRFYGTNVLTILKTKRGAAVSGIFRNIEGKVVAELETNRFTIGTKFSVARPDAHSLTVRDDYGDEVLNVRFVNDDVLTISGLLRGPDGFSVHIETNALLVLKDDREHRRIVGNFYYRSGTIFEVRKDGTAGFMTPGF